MDLALECLTRFWKLLGWSPVTEICLNFGCPILFFTFWTEIVFFGTGSVFSRKTLFLSLDFGLVTGLKFGILIFDQKELGVSAVTGIGFSNFLCAADKDNFSVSCSDWWLWFVTGIVFVSSLVTHKDLSWRVAE